MPESAAAKFRHIENFLHLTSKNAQSQLESKQLGDSFSRLSTSGLSACSSFSDGTLKVVVRSRPRQRERSRLACVFKLFHCYPTLVERGAPTASERNRGWVAPWQLGGANR